ncbi:hypothetical protein HID58_047055, partial [Brassica napus]
QHFISQTNHFSITRRNRENSQKRVVWSDTHPKVAQGGFNGDDWQRLRGTTRGGHRANKLIARTFKPDMTPLKMKSKNTGQAQAVQNAPSPATRPKGCGRDIKSRNRSYNRRYARREKKHKESWRLSISRLNKRRARARPPSENTTTAGRPQNPRPRQTGEESDWSETNEQDRRQQRRITQIQWSRILDLPDPREIDPTRAVSRSSHLASAPEKPRTPLVSARSGGEIQRHQAKRLRRTENRNRERREPETRYRRWRRRLTRQACRRFPPPDRDQMLAALGLEKNLGERL